MTTPTFTSHAYFETVNKYVDYLPMYIVDPEDIYTMSDGESLEKSK